MQESESRFLMHTPCGNCGSSDANSLYDDGHQYCFSCGTYVGGEGESASPPPPPAFEAIQVEPLDLSETRKLTRTTLDHFGYGQGTYRGERVQVACYFDERGQLIGQKVRGKDKRFAVVGDVSHALPFGAHLWPRTGKMLVVTEGEIDAMSMSQVQGNKWPVVSIACGAGPQVKKYIARHRDYFLGFEKVVLMFDMDEPGRAASEAAAQVIGPRTHIAELPSPFKDANEMLKAGAVSQLIDAMWRARRYQPAGLIEATDERLKQRAEDRPVEGLSWAFPALTAQTYGIRTGELIAIGAGTGIGKTDFITQNIAHLVSQHRVPVGYFALEQQPEETLVRVLGKIAKKTFHLPDSGWTKDDFDAAWETLKQGGKLFLYDSFGVNEWETIKSKIEYLRHAEGVQYFFLDHLTALAAMEEDERKSLAMIMADLGGLVKRLDCTVVFVSHLATPEGKPHEEGGRVMIRHLKGARDIGFWCSLVIGMERDQQAEDESERHTTTIRLLKHRLSGLVGNTFFVRYDHAMGTLYETESPDKQKERAHAFVDTDF